MKQNQKTKQLKWTKPTVKSISFQELSSLITVSACSKYVYYPCMYNMK